MQLGLGTGFKSPAEIGAEFNNLFDHLVLLIDLDWIDAVVLPLIASFFAGDGKALMDLLHAAFENVRKT